MRNLTGYWMGLLAAGAVTLTAGCNKDNETGAVTSKANGETSSAPSSEAVENRDHALIRAVNAIPDKSNLTIYAGDSAAFPNVGYKKTTGYEEIPGNLFNFRLKAANAANGEALAQNRENLHDGGHYTVVALPSEDPNDENLRVLDDDLKPGAETSGKARVRFINGIAGDTDVDVFIKGQKDPIFDGVNFKAEAGWKDVEPASGTLVVRPDNKATTLASLANVQLQAGKSYTFVVVGKPGKYEIVKVEDTVAKDPS
jgi:Domain of unknown function (DUF4397)